MSLNAPPSDLTAQIQWLVDRASISDLLVEFARTLDEQEWDANTALYVPEGVFMVGDVFRLVGHEQLALTGSPRGLAQYRGTWHLSANHAIEMSGDTANSARELVDEVYRGESRRVLATLIRLLGGEPADVRLEVLAALGDDLRRGL